MTIRSSTEIFVKKAQNIHNNYDYSNVVYVNARTKIIIECFVHGKFEQTPDAHLHGQGCPKCKGIKIGNKLRFDNEYVDNFLHTNNIAIKRLGSYVNSGTSLQFQCLNCDNKWETTTEHIIYQRTGCPHCSRFKNEKIVGDWFNKNNIKYDKLCIELNGKRYCPDYFIPSFNMIIEYNGDQHYRPVCFKGMSLDIAKNNYKKQIIRDDIVKKYCKINELLLLEIDGRKYKCNKLESFLNNYFETLVVKND